MKACSKCGIEKRLVDFYKHPLGADGHRGDCKACVLKARRERYETDGETLRERVRRYQAANPEKVAAATQKWRQSERGAAAIQASTRRRYLQETYGITVEDYDALFAGQGNACAICRGLDPGKCWTVDHDHVTGAVRGILCWHCNVGMGHFRDDIGNLVAAADYLMRSQVVTVVEAEDAG